MGANGAKKGWLDRVFRGETVTEEAYGAQEADKAQQAGVKQASRADAAMDGTYARRPQAARAPARKDNVVEFPGRAQGKAPAAAGGGAKASEAAGGTYARATSGFSARETAGREPGGGSGGGT
ncbi:MAG: hypothetical protein FWC27_05155, partial [Firmicutes bacterium]|nr:hypothetical protein [Bacillota bacterium]